MAKPPGSRKKVSTPSLRARLRILRRGEIVLGPGKADLLESIAATGELRRAASRLAMSYMRAWTLVRMMNRAFRKPLVATVRGGPLHGSARLTRTGKRVLALYREMETLSLAASEPAFARLRRLLPPRR